MTCMALVAVVVGLVTARSWPHLEGLKKRSTVDPAVQTQTVVDMIARLLPSENSEKFVVTVDPTIAADDGLDVFVLDQAGQDQVSIVGSSGVAAAMGFQYYVTQYCGGHFSWSGNQVALPSPLPWDEPGPVRVVANDLFRYYQNVCTVSYSSAWWDWDRWEREIDWMAINGINLPLAFTGQEEIFRRVFLRWNFTQADLDTFFAGPAFLAWGRMGNIDGWGGPLPESWYQGQLALQHQILDRMRNFGMVPVLPAFSGHVPKTITDLYPDVNVTVLDSWNGFPEPYCCSYLLDPAEPLFQDLGAEVIREMQAEFGVDHVYNCDTFNEMTPPTTDPNYVSGVGQGIFQAMTNADPDAIWLMQGWLFLNSYWTPELARALLRSVPLGRMIVLDLHSEVQPLYRQFDSYYGQPWVWCMLHDFGGVKGLYGSVSTVNVGPFMGRAYPNSTMVGTGLTPEGIEQNDVIYEFMNQMAWRTEPVTDLDVWTQNYTQQRYGAPNDDVAAAWRHLIRTVYDCLGVSFHGQFILVTRPSLTSHSPICYLKSHLADAWDSYVTACSDQQMTDEDLFRHDLVDVSREALIVVSDVLYGQLTDAYDARDADAFQDAGDRLLDLLDDLETLLASDVRFLLGPWLESAKALATNDNESALYEYNARNQITLWGPDGEIVDYATKQWSGIVADYYRPRWQLFIEQVAAALTQNATFDETAFANDVFHQVEQPFTFDRKAYPTSTSGDLVAIAQALYDKWRGTMKLEASYRRELAAILSSKSDYRSSYRRR